MAIEQGSHDVPVGHVVVETIGYDITCRSKSVLSHVAAWGSDVNVTVDKLLPDQEYTCDILIVNKHDNRNFVTITVTTLSSG